MAIAVLELFHSDRWWKVGSVAVADPTRGIGSPSRFEYDFDYLDQHPGALAARDSRAVSCRYPVGYDVFDEPRWPPVLLDLIPAGAARRYWEATLALPNTDGSDWPVLLAGAHNPPGNVRIAHAAVPPQSHPGFPRSDILERREGFIEYARASGAPISGSSGAGGDSPKFLLREDHEDRWHADGALSDERTKACWLVKFPRTRDDVDRLILEAEAAYHRVARRVGLRAYESVTWEQDCLFVPRFDHHARDRGPISRLGLESLYSLAGVSDWGAWTPKELLAAALARFATDPRRELRELLTRDVFDVALGNTDNHGRNTSVLKSDGTVELSPIYDFCPMFLDPRGVARVCRWADKSEFPDWVRVAEALAPLGLETSEARRCFQDCAEKVVSLPPIMQDCGVPKVVRDRLAERIARVEHDLRAVTS